MNVNEILRAGLHDLAEEVTEISDLHRVAVERGRHRQSVRRATTAGGAVLSVVAVAGIGVVVAHNTGGGRSPIQTGGSGTQKVVADPWWQTWPAGRHDGPVDQTFLDAIDPGTNDTVYAAGTTSDGTEWAMLTSPTYDDKVGWFVGFGGKPAMGDVAGTVDPELTWSTWSAIARGTYNDEMGPNHQWLIVVGRPSTTEIDYSADGTTWQPLETHDGIAVTYIDSGYPPASARVRLSDANGVYAEGTPIGAGANADPSSTPTPGTATPLATPTPSPTTP